MYPIELHFFSFDINAFEQIDISHLTFPNLPVLTGIAMSSALPGFFAPVFIPATSPHYSENRNKCFTDGGIRLNYPLSKCIEKYPNTYEILGITIQADSSEKTNNDNNNCISPESNILEYFVEFTSKVMRFLDKLAPSIVIPYEIRCISQASLFDLEKCSDIIQSADARKQWIEQGMEDAMCQLEQFNSNNKK